MIITRETDYALRILRALRDGQQKNISQICAVERVPTQFAYKILKKLSSAGLVQIIRGAGGGYRLTADLGGVSLLRLMEVMGENWALNACISTDFDCMHNRETQPCGINVGLTKMQDQLNQLLGSCTLTNLLHTVGR